MPQPTVPSLDGKNPINGTLAKSLRNYRNLKGDTSLKPVQYSQKREMILKDFLSGLAEEFGRVIKPAWIDANGEMNFNVDPQKGPNDYGDELATIISQVPRRMGEEATHYPSRGESNWCRINHFAVESLLNLVQNDLKKVPNPRAEPGAGHQTPSP